MLEEKGFKLSDFVNMKMSISKSENLDRTLTDQQIDIARKMERMIRYIVNIGEQMMTWIHPIS